MAVGPGTASTSMPAFSASSTAIIASLMMSAAVPWMGLFIAQRSPKARTA